MNVLREMIENAIELSGLPKDKSSFVQHITLARVGKPRKDTNEKVKNWLDVASGGFSEFSFDVTSFELFRSTLSSHGAQYDILQSYPLLPASEGKRSASSVPSTIFQAIHAKGAVKAATTADATIGTMEEVIEVVQTGAEMEEC
jgi:hypothetical protein